MKIREQSIPVSPAPEPNLALVPPGRRFLLVGDSGEGDPEMYGDLARERPAQAARILIPGVTGDPPDSQRYREAARGLPKDLWMVF